MYFGDDGPDHRRHRRELHLLEREAGVLGGDPDVAHQRVGEAAGDAVAVDRGDDRLVDPVLAHVEERDLADALVRAVVVPDRLHHREVGAGAERALAAAGEDRHVQLGVVPEVGPDLALEREHLGVVRVQLLRPVQRDQRDVAPLLVQDDWFGHGSSLFRAGNAGPLQMAYYDNIRRSWGCRRRATTR
jgi:hypothetical protein